MREHQYRGLCIKQIYYWSNMNPSPHSSSVTAFNTLLGVCGLCHPWLFQSRKEALVLTDLEVAPVNYCVGYTAQQKLNS